MKYCLFLIIAIIWISCAGSKEIQKKDKTSEQEVQYDESFDPLSLNDDDLIKSVSAVIGSISSVVLISNL